MPVAPGASATKWEKKMKSAMLATLAVGFCLATAEKAVAITYSHTGLIDVSAPHVVTAVCSSSYSGSIFNLPPPFDLYPSHYMYACELRRQGTLVASSPNEIVFTEFSNPFEAKFPLIVPRQDNCIYCINNRGEFRGYRLNAPPPYYVVLSAGKAKLCDSTSKGRGGVTP